MCSLDEISYFSNNTEPLDRPGVFLIYSNDATDDSSYFKLGVASNVLKTLQIIDSSHLSGVSVELLVLAPHETSTTIYKITKNKLKEFAYDSYRRSDWLSMESRNEIVSALQTTCRAFSMAKLHFGESIIDAVEEYQTFYEQDKKRGPANIANAN
jgi:hypothetical protein